MAKDVDINSRANGIREVVDRLAPGTRLTLIFRSALGEECRRHRIVICADSQIVRIATVPPEKEPVVEIEFWPGDRVVLRSDGFMLVSPCGTSARYVWGHV